MAFPQDPLPVKVEIHDGDDWVDITADVYTRDRIEITRGFQDESSKPEPSECVLTINNRNGHYSPRNPLGDYYGKIGRNTPLRVRVRSLVTADASNGTNDDAHVAPSVDLDGDEGLLICGWATTEDSPGAINYTVPSSMTAGTAQNGTFGTSQTAYETLSSSGATGTRTATSSVTLERWCGVSIALPGDITVEELLQDTVNDDEVTLSTASDTEAGWWLLAVQFHDLIDPDSFEEPSGGPWVEIASVESEGDDWSLSGKVWMRPVTVAGTNTVTFGLFSGESADNWGHLYVLSGVDGWPQPLAVRFYGEVSEWPSRWDVSGKDVYVPVKAQGILRRLGQGDRPLRSPLLGSTLAANDQGQLVAYWPMEDPEGSSRFASALPGGSPMTYSGGAPDFAAIGPFLGSARVAVLDGTTTLSGQIPPHTPGKIAVRFILDVPSVTGWADATPIFHVHQSTGGSTVATWELQYKTGGALALVALDENGSELDSSGALGFSIDGEQIWVGFEVFQLGNDTIWTLYNRSIDDDGVTVSEGGFYGQTFSGLDTTFATKIVFAPEGGLDELAIGHVIISTDTTFGDLYAFDDVKSGLVSYIGESAGDRAERVCDEIGVTLTAKGNFDDTVPMGKQPTPATFSESLGETYNADMGWLYENRDSLGLTYRTRRSAYNQPAALELDYEGAGEVAPPLEPTDDDQHVSNDVTVTRKDGSSARAVKETGPLSVNAPPDGVGRYEDSVTVNVAADGLLEDQAGWRLHVGTVDETRYPELRIDMAALANAGKDGLLVAAAMLDIADRVTVDNPPDWLPPDQIDVLAIGFNETIDLYSWDIVANCVPARPYQIAEVEHELYAVVGSDGSTTATSFQAGTSTSLSVEIAEGYPLWTHEADFDVMISGVRLTVTAISGTSSPQTFTVTQEPVNGVKKTIAAGEAVELFHQSYIGL